MVNIIKGATKAGVHRDRKKEASKYASRGQEKLEKCRQCGFPIKGSGDEAEDYEEDGFCSMSCYDYHTESVGEE